MLSAGWKKLSLVGEAIDLVVLNDLKNRLNDLVELGMELRYLWGLKVMVTFSSTVGVRKFLDGKRKEHELLFSDQQIWDGQLIQFERIAWVHILGVPIQLWEDNTFNGIRQTFGKIVEFSTASFVNGNMSYEEMGIINDKPGRISTNINSEWGGQVFPVRIEETSCCWAPRCIKISENNASSSSASAPTAGAAQGHSKIQMKRLSRLSVMGKEEGTPKAHPRGAIRKKEIGSQIFSVGGGELDSGEGWESEMEEGEIGGAQPVALAGELVEDRREMEIGAHEGVEAAYRSFRH
ncbi:hypothetical protein L1987_43510 [Smallanthus sonchifolius]|uniref:Uncharacterized protein n=1 Tax=Smallanthus sonchifolius TaxID=185202 RepID=A0ACB9GMU1_9ASTR|nr:hypothetical protein L1987_43510 [Smallanthus sonchifolius]